LILNEVLLLLFIHTFKNRLANVENGASFSTMVEVLADEAESEFTLTALSKHIPASNSRNSSSLSNWSPSGLFVEGNFIGLFELLILYPRVLGYNLLNIFISDEFFASRVWTGQVGYLPVVDERLTVHPCAIFTEIVVAFGEDEE
jgi:hypothetical protein